MVIDITHLTIKPRSLKGGWTVTTTDLWMDNLPKKPTVYSVKMNKWKAKRMLRVNMIEVENSSGEIELCPKCEGFGYVLNNFTITHDCKYCKGLGIVDWIKKIRK